MKNDSFLALFAEINMPIHVIVDSQMEECSIKLGVPVNCIFPVKNYHNEDPGNTKMDILILKALLNIVNFASDYVQDQTDNEFMNE